MTRARAVLLHFILLFAAAPSFAAPTMSPFNGATPQSTCAMCFYEQAVGVSIFDPAAGRAVAGVPVTFTPSDPALFIPGAGPGPWTTATDAFGIASLPYPGPVVATAGAFTLVATATGMPDVVNFALSGAGEPPARIVGGGVQAAAMIGTAYPQYISAQVVGPGDQPMPNAVVVFSMSGEGGAGVTFTPGPGASGISYGPPTTGPMTYARAGASGMAYAPTMRANDVVGRGNVVASTLNGFSSGPYGFFNSAPNAASIELLPGTSPQQAHVGAFFPVVLGAKVRDAAGNPVRDAAVTFRLASDLVVQGYGFYVTEPATSNQWVAYTGDDGVALTPARFFVTKAGPIDLQAMVPGAASVPFALTGLAGGVTQLDLVSGDGQRAIVGTTYPLPWTFRALGADGQPIPNAGLRVYVDPRPDVPGGSFAGTTALWVMADAGGVATTPPFTANGTTGTNTGLVSGFAGQADDPSRLVRFENLSAALSVSAIDEVPSLNAPVGGTAYAPYRAIVRNQLGSPVAGAAFTFQADPACARFLGQASYSGLTDAQGLAVSPPLEAVGASLACETRLTVAGAPEIVAFAIHTFLLENVYINTYPASLLVQAGSRNGVWGAIFADGQGVYVPASMGATADRNGASATVESIEQPIGQNVVAGTVVMNAKSGSYEIVIRAGPARASIPVTQKVGRIN